SSLIRARSSCQSPEPARASIFRARARRTKSSRARSTAREYVRSPLSRTASSRRRSSSTRFGRFIHTSYVGHRPWVNVAAPALERPRTRRESPLAVWLALNGAAIVTAIAMAVAAGAGGSTSGLVLATLAGYLIVIHSLVLAAGLFGHLTVEG